MSCSNAARIYPAGLSVVVVDKRWCSGAGHSDMIVFCKMDPEAKGARGLGAVYVKKDALGVSFGPAETLMGFRGVPSADIYFEDVKIPSDDVLLPAVSVSMHLTKPVRTQLIDQAC